MMTDKILPVISCALVAVGLTLATAAPVQAQAQAQYRQTFSHDVAKCSSGAGPSVLVTISGVESSSGSIRVQSYRGIKADWLESGRWLGRIEMPAKAGTMKVCVPVPSAGTYGIAVRHDANANGKTDLRTDGAAMSGNPSLNIFNLGKPSYTKTAFNAGSGVTSISINMRYM